MEPPTTDQPSLSAVPVPPAKPEQRDEDGLPLDRDPTLDDVRGGANHFKFAVGCSAVVVVLICAFWVLRVLVAQ